jgi:hypothetical protein
VTKKSPKVRDFSRGRALQVCTSHLSHSLIFVFFVSYIHSYSILPDAGTSWESGVRRSTRFRTKPLECWKGERTVYGRVHESEYNRSTLLYLEIWPNHLFVDGGDMSLH